MTRIKEILKEKNMTVNQLADMLHVSRQAVSKQIKGKMLIETAQRIADALDVPLWHLFETPSTTFFCPHCGKKITIETKKDE